MSDNSPSGDAQRRSVSGIGYTYGPNNDHGASQPPASLLAMAPDVVPHPSANASERERMLWSALGRAHAEVRELQSQIRTLLDLNLRYAQQLHQALAVDPPRKRPRSDAIDDDRPPLPPFSAGSDTAPHRRRRRRTSPACSQDPVQPPSSYRPPQQHPPLPPLSGISPVPRPAPMSVVDVAAAAEVAAAMMTTEGGAIMSSEASSTNIHQLLVQSSTPTLSTSAAAFDPHSITLAEAASAMSLSAPSLPPLPSRNAASLEPPPLPPPQPRQSSLTVHESSGTAGGSSGSKLATGIDVNELVLGDSEAIPSIGKFSSPRTLYMFRERVRQYEQQNGAHWREKMDSKRRQNWSRIGAVYNRILKLRGATTSDADLERALQATENEMAAHRATLTRYSQIVRKQLNLERRQSARVDSAGGARPTQPPVQPPLPPLPPPPPGSTSNF